jgi:hypothetical protein
MLLIVCSIVPFVIFVLGVKRNNPAWIVLPLVVCCALMLSFLVLELDVQKVFTRPLVEDLEATDALLVSVLADFSNCGVASSERFTDSAI